MINSFIRPVVRTFALVSLLVMVGCSTQQTSQGPAPVIDKAPATTKPSEPVVVQPQPSAVPQTPVTPPVQTLTPATQSLARQARSQYQQQDYQGAIATAERGLRIERHAAELYLVLAQAYVQLGQEQKANLFVQQGLRYAPQGSEVAGSLIRLRELLGQ